MKTIDDIVAYNDENRGTEGAQPGDHPAFSSGQVSIESLRCCVSSDKSKDNLRETAQTRGTKTESYHQALKYIRRKSREEGIDAALKHVDKDGQTIELDALLLCDRKGAGQQLAAQAGYPVICVPIGADTNGIPVSLSLQHSAWKEGALIKWTSAIEDLVKDQLGGRPRPEYRMYLSKNIPVIS